MGSPAEAEELTLQLIEWMRGKELANIIPALVVTAAKAAVYADVPLGHLIALIDAVYKDETGRRSAKGN
jgi:hypothetical protein